MKLANVTGKTASINLPKAGKLAQTFKVKKKKKKQYLCSEIKGGIIKGEMPVFFLTSKLVSNDIIFSLFKINALSAMSS